MADYLVTDDTLTKLANSIRAKLGTSDTMTVDEMPDAVSSISGGGTEGAVLYNIGQELNGTERFQARDNIRAAYVGDVDDVRWKVKNLSYNDLKNKPFYDETNILDLAEVFNNTSNFIGQVEGSNYLAFKLPYSNIRKENLDKIKGYYLALEGDMDGRGGTEVMTGAAELLVTVPASEMFPDADGTLYIYSAELNGEVISEAGAIIEMRNTINFQGIDITPGLYVLDIVGAMWTKALDPESDSNIEMSEYRWIFDDIILEKKGLEPKYVENYCQLKFYSRNSLYYLDITKNDIIETIPLTLHTSAFKKEDFSNTSNIAYSKLEWCFELDETILNNIFNNLKESNNIKIFIDIPLKAYGQTDSYAYIYPYQVDYPGLYFNFGNSLQVRIKAAAAHGAPDEPV